MNIQQLEYLLALRKYRHFVKAAEECGVTQPTLSAMIARLEDELEVKLLDRSSQPLSLSPIGERIADEAMGVMRGIRSIVSLAEDEHSSLSGKVTVGILPTIAPFLLPLLLPRMSKKMAGVSVKFIELATSACEAGLREGSLDLAIVAGDMKDQKWVRHTLYYEEFVGYVSQKSPLYTSTLIRSADIDPESLWLLDDGHCFRNQLVRFCEFKKAHPKHIDFVLGGIETYMRLVESGHGVTFVPELAVETMSGTQKEYLRRFAIPRPVREVMLVHTPLFARSKLVEYIRALIISAVPERLLTMHRDQALATRLK